MLLITVLVMKVHAQLAKLRLPKRAIVEIIAVVALVIFCPLAVLRWASNRMICEWLDIYNWLRRWADMGELDA